MTNPIGHKWFTVTAGDGVTYPPAAGFGAGVTTLDSTSDVLNAAECRILAIWPNGVPATVTLDDTITIEDGDGTDYLTFTVDFGSSTERIGTRTFGPNGIRIYRAGVSAGSSGSFGVIATDANASPVDYTVVYDVVRRDQQSFTPSP